MNRFLIIILKYYYFKIIFIEKKKLNLFTLTEITKKFLIEEKKIKKFFWDET